MKSDFLFVRIRSIQEEVANLKQVETDLKQRRNAEGIKYYYCCYEAVLSQNYFENNISATFTQNISENKALFL